MFGQIFKFILMIGGVGLIVYVALSVLLGRSTVRVEKPETGSKTEVEVSPNPETVTLKKAVGKALEGTTGTYGIAIKNLKTGESYYTNEHKAFEIGSLYKVWIMAAYFNELEKGDLKEDEILSEDVSVLNNKFNIAPENAEMTKGRINLTAKEAMEQMITISHNYSALLLTDRIKLAKVEDFLQKHSFKESFLGEPPKTTTNDVALFFEKLYKNELANQENTQRMVETLKRQTLRNKLPKYLPVGAVLAHKTGEIGFFTHDGGIVFSDKGDYLIVVMSESDYPSGAQDRIADVSKVVYEYFTR